jgi:hypothetical protein
MRHIQVAESRPSLRHCLAQTISVVLHSIQRKLQLLQQALGLFRGPAAAARTSSALLPAFIHKHGTVQDDSALHDV